jgi:hypothetical protein
LSNLEPSAIKSATPEHEAGSRRECLGLWRIFIEVSIYKKKRRISISEMSCATVSLLPWVELPPGRKRVRSGAN